MCQVILGRVTVRFFFEKLDYIEGQLDCFWKS